MYSIEIKEACRRAFSFKQLSTVLILFVGLTLTTVMFAVGYGYSVFSIPFKDSGHLVTVGYPSKFMGQVLYDSTRNPMLEDVPVSLFIELKERKDVFIDLAAYKRRRQEVYGRQAVSTSWKIMAPKQNASFPGYDVTSNYFDLLGVSFQGLQEWKLYSETIYPVPLIVTHKTGMKDFGVEAIGKEFNTDNSKITLYGILPEGFVSVTKYNENLGFSPFIPYRTDDDDVRIIARLAPGITPQLAEQMLSGMPDQFASFSEDPIASRIIVRYFQEELLKPSRRIVLGACLMGGLIFILCSANVAGIYLTRCNYQLGEFALKHALGANFRNLILPMFFELVVLSSIAAVIAGMIAPSIIAILVNMVPVTNISFGKPASGWFVFVFLLACMIAIVFVSLAPAIMFVLKCFRQGFGKSYLTIFHRYKVMRGLLITSQVAIATTLLAISNMAVRSYLDLFNKDIGVDSSVLVITADYSWKVPDTQIGAIINETLEALHSGDTGIRVAACIGNLFSDTTMMVPYSKDMPIVRGMLISPGFVRAVNGKLLAGREFNNTDRLEDVVLLNNAFAKASGWSPQEAVGQIVQSASGQTMTVIGVIGDFLNVSWEDGTVEPTVFKPITMYGTVRGGGVHYIVHSDSLKRIGNIEHIINKPAMETVITRNTTWNKLLNTSASGKILASFIVIIFTVTSIVIVVTGMVDTILFIVSRRTREIAIHLAMGATTGRVFWIVISDVVKAGIIGLLLGTLASWWIGKASVHFFYNGLQYQGLSELIFIANLMFLIIITAAAIPALRILRIEINQALAAE